jgi:O-antigen ligase
MSAIRPGLNAARYGEWLAEWGLIAYIVLLPLSHVSPWQIPTRILLIAAASGGLVAVFERGEISFPRSWIVGLFMLYAAISALSALVSTDVTASGAAVSKVLLRSLVVFLLVACAPREPARWRRLGLALATSALALSVVSLGLAAADVRNPWGGLVGPLFDYNSLCMFLIPTLPFAFQAASQAAGRVGRVFWTLAATVVTTAVFLSFSRIGWAAFAVLVVVLFLFDRPGRPRVALASLGGLALFVLLVPDLRQIAAVTDNTRFVVTGDLEPSASVMKQLRLKDLGTFNDRLEYAWKPALAIVREHPWLGGGYGPSTFERLTPSDQPRLSHEHDALLSVAVQSGVFAAAAYAALLVVCVARVGSRLRRLGPIAQAARASLIALLGAFVAEYVFHGLAEPTNNGRMGILFAALTGLAAALVTPAGSELVLKLGPRRRDQAPVVPTMPAGDAAVSSPTSAETSSRGADR